MMPHHGPPGPTPSRIPPHLSSPHWPGDPAQRPPTDAESTRQRRQWRRRLRGMGLLGLVALVAFVAAPLPLLRALQDVPEPVARPAALLTTWLRLGYPLARAGVLTLLGYLLLHLLTGLILLQVQARHRRQRELTTFLVDLARREQPELGRGVDLFAGIGDLLNAVGRSTGREATLVFALVNHQEDQRVRLVIRGSAATPAQHATLHAVRTLVSGAAPGTTTRPAPDEVQALLRGDAARGAVAAPALAGFVGYADFVLRRHPSYPLKDLALFVGSDPLGPLALALERRAGVRATGLELILRALPATDDWRAPLREQIGAIQGSVHPEDRAAYDALLRKVASPGFDVVVRGLVVGPTKPVVVQQLRAIDHALRTLSQPAGTARQSLWPRGRWGRARSAGFTLVPLTAATTGAAPLPAWGWRALPAVSSGTLLGGLLGGLFTQALPIPPFPTLLLIALMALALTLAGLAIHPRCRVARARTRLAMLRSHAHHSVWPGATWTIFPAPGTRRSILAPYELAALWHPPARELEAAFAWRSSRSLPAPAAAFLSPDDAQRSEQRQIVPRPPTPQALGACRLGIAYAYQRNGELALIGPTLRDLRQGWDTMGGTGSGKSSLIETMVFEIARNGGGCGVIDAKGDLADRLLRILPRAAADRVVVIDTTAPMVPCINPFDRRIIGTKSRDVVAGEFGEIFARIEPEIWAGALGMQQALLLGISAILEGEPEPSLLHLQRFLLAPSYRHVVLERVYDRSVRDYWLNQVPKLPEKIKTSMESLKRRIDMLIGSEIGQQLLCQPQSTIDLGALIRSQGILIIKFVPERIGHSNAAYWAAVLFQSIVSATFQQQAESDPEQRWDWPLFVDEVQMFVTAERAADAERMWTRTRSMGVGLIGAHQGLNQLGEHLGGIVLNVIGGLCLTSGVRAETRSFVEAFAHQGLQVEDFTGITAREELLIRFPVAGRDLGLMAAIPRARPTAPSAPAQALPFSLPPYLPQDQDEATALALLDDLEQQVAALQAQSAGAAHGAAAPDARPSADLLFAETVYRAVANRWLDQLHPARTDAWQAQLPTLSGEEAQARAWTDIQRLIHDLRVGSARRGRYWAAALAAAAAARSSAADLTQVSQYRYGVNPIVNACYVAAVVRQSAPAALSERRARPRAAEGPPAQIAPPRTPVPSAVVVAVPARPPAAPEHDDAR